MPTVRIEGGLLDEEPIAAFELDQTEVTVAMYDACVRAGRCLSPGLAEDGRIGRAHCTYARVGLEVTPVNCVTPLDADAYCAYAGKRLPSEEEWEWVSAGREDDRRFVWGSGYGIPEGVCWNRKADGPCDVGSSAADTSRDGVSDLAGNVQEWTTSTLEGRRVGRGGSWFAEFGVALQIATFVSGDANTRSDLVGFRCARSVD
jgi:formylglycine-generating enzyme required for sulfatase activity